MIASAIVSRHDQWMTSYRRHGKPWRPVSDVEPNRGAYSWSVAVPSHFGQGALQRRSFFRISWARAAIPYGIFPVR